MIMYLAKVQTTREALVYCSAVLGRRFGNTSRKIINVLSSEGHIAIKKHIAIIDKNWKEK